MSSSTASHAVTLPPTWSVQPGSGGAVVLDGNPASALKPATLLQVGNGGEVRYRALAPMPPGSEVRPPRAAASSAHTAQRNVRVCVAPPPAGGSFLLRARTKLAQGWPKSWTKIRLLTGILTQNAGPSRAIGANPLQTFPQVLLSYVGLGWALTAEGILSGAEVCRGTLPSPLPPS